MTALSQEERRRKLRELAADGGHASVVEMLKAHVTDSVAPAICTERDCSYTTEMEPDQDRGYCELCGKNTVARRSCSPASSEEAAMSDPKTPASASSTTPSAAPSRRHGRHYGRRRRLPDMVKAAALQKAAMFDQFNEDNDPHGEHDFGSFELCGRKFFWKIDYYDRTMELGSRRPDRSPDKTTRVMTIMFASEY